MPSTIPGLDVHELSDASEAVDPKPGWQRRVAGSLRGGAKYVGDAARGAATSMRGATGDVGSKAASTLRTAAPAAGRLAGYAAGVSGEAKDVWDVGGSSKSDKLDVATQYAESAGKLGTAATGAALGQALIPVPGLGAAVGGLAGYWAGDKAIQGARGLLGQDTRPIAAQVREREAAPVPAPVSPQPTRPDSWRGKGYDDPRRLDMDPTRASLGASRDFTPELNRVPDALPAGLRSGVIVKTIGPDGQPTYSGRDVQAGAQMVDGAGKSLRQGGSTGIYPGGQALPADPGRALVSPADPAGPTVAAIDGAGSRARDWAQFTQGVDRSNLNTALRDGLRSTSRRVRSAALAASQGITAADINSGDAHYSSDNQLAGARYNADQTLRGRALDADATRYASDNQLRGTLATAQAQGLRTSLDMQTKLRQQALMGQIFRQAGGDPTKAEQLAMAYGLDPEQFTKLAEAQQSRAGKDRTDADSYAKGESVVTDKNGTPQVNEALLAQNNTALNELTGGAWGRASAAERQQMAPAALAQLRLRNGINTLRDGGWGHVFDATSPERKNLPDMQGGSVDRVGLVEGALSKDISRGDYRLRTKDGQEIYVPADAVDGTTLKMLEARGATLRVNK